MTSMKIGIIGAGNIGGTLAHLWVDAGHDVIVSSRHPDELADLVRELGNHACASTPEEAARSGEVVLLSIPLHGVKALSDGVRQALRGKIVLDTCNPYPDRDGEAAHEVLRAGQGTGVWTARQLPGARVVRAFNTVPAAFLRSEARRIEDPVGIPLASDDPEALRVVSRLVRDAGFGPVIVGDLGSARDFDPGAPAYGSGASQGELESFFHRRSAA